MQHCNVVALCCCPAGGDHDAGAVHQGLQVTHREIPRHEGLRECRRGQKVSFGDVISTIFPPI